MCLLIGRPPGSLWVTNCDNMCKWIFSARGSRNGRRGIGVEAPHFEGLAIFAKVVQTRSVVGAAAEIRLSKASVSKAVGRIEKKFGARLFNRSSRRLALTEDGCQLYDRAAHILAEGEAAKNEGVARLRCRADIFVSLPRCHLASCASHPL